MELPVCYFNIHLHTAREAEWLVEQGRWWATTHDDSPDTLRGVEALKNCYENAKNGTDDKSNCQLPYEIIIYVNLVLSV